MNTQELLDCERQQTEKIKKFIFLPNYFKIVGLFITIIGFISKIIFSYFQNDNETISFITGNIVENLILVAMLMIILSKEKIEDELIEKLRNQAFMFAFLTGVLFTIFQPYITYFVSLIVKSGKANIERLDDFIILWFMLVVYIFHFHLLKKTS
jgi:hypothetical protein